MGIIKRYVDYLKDNPKGYWFKRKLYGWGWTPARWQGWAVLGVFILYVTWIATEYAGLADSGPISNDEVVAFVIQVMVAVALLIYISYRKGEKPRWQWGNSR